MRLPDLAVPRAGDPATEARLAVQDEFVAACKDEGVRVWAEVLHPVLDFAPAPADADALDDPATREAWREAVADTNFPAASLLLAAPWDPRLEILVQRRLRDWARAFNPHTGLRRCDDPAYALFSFSSLWWEDLDSAAPPGLPPFLERELLDAWNDWLYERHGTDQALRDRFGLGPGETLASNSAAFPPPELAPDSARTPEQRAFLHALSTDHLARLLSPFSAFGQTARTAPRLVRHGGPEPFLGRFSTVALAEPVRGGAAPGSDLPLVLDASRAADPARGSDIAAKEAIDSSPPGSLNAARVAVTAWLRAATTASSTSPAPPARVSPSPPPARPRPSRSFHRPEPPLPSSASRAARPPRSPRNSRRPACRASFSSASTRGGRPPSGSRTGRTRRMPRRIRNRRRRRPRPGTPGRTRT